MIYTIASNWAPITRDEISSHLHDANLVLATKFCQSMIHDVSTFDMLI